MEKTKIWKGFKNTHLSHNIKNQEEESNECGSEQKSIPEICATVLKSFKRMVSYWEVWRLIYSIR